MAFIGKNLHFRCFFLILFLISAYASDTNDSGLGSPHSLTPTPASSRFQRLLRRDDSADQQDLMSLGARCVYPVSGTYTKFQRILFYIVLSVVFAFRFHKWILLVGMRWLGVFTATTAIHAVALSIQACLGVDTDVITAGGICQVGGIASLVFSLYPPKHFRRPTSTVLMAWTILLVLATNLALWTELRWRMGGITIDLDAGCGTQKIDSARALHLCNNACGVVEHMPVLFHTADDVMVALNCFASSWSGDEYVFVDITSATDTSIWIQGPSCGISTTNGTDSAPNVSVSLDVDDSNVGSSLPTSLLLLITPFLVLGIAVSTTTLSIDYPPRFQRNWIFRRLTSSDPSPHQMTTSRYIFCCISTALWYMLRPIMLVLRPLVSIMRSLFRRRPITAGPWLLKIPGAQPKDSLSISRINLARWVACAWYCWVMLSYLIFPALLVSAIQRLESVARELPEQESPVAVGQWSSWAGVFLTVLVAIYVRIQSRGVEGEDATKDDQIFLNNVEDEERPGHLGIDDLPKWIQHRPQLCSYFSGIQREFSDTKLWWKDPATMSWRQEPTDLTWPKTQKATHWRPLINSTEFHDADFEELLNVTQYTPPYRPTSSTNSTASLVSLSSARLSTRPSSILSPPRPYPKCSRKAYAAYLPCVCEACKGKLADLVEYNALECATSPSRVPSGSDMELEEIHRQETYLEDNDSSIMVAGRESLQIHTKAGKKEKKEKKVSSHWTSCLLR
ncbi:hypothetical protein BJ166DRAFT_11175 [Pestalotiopsis sp. NC0098]|nr:hypothetical protein BJ166DRAFT_11175 [Pestalotiopsis sp. NC0098]